MLKKILSLFLILLIGLVPLPASAIKYKGDLEAKESLTLPEQGATPASPAVSKYKLYFKDDGAPYSVDASGNENPIDRAGFKNYLINGGFRLWQRGASFTSSDTYGADRWRHAYADGAGTSSRQPFTLGQTDVPQEPHYYWRHNRSTPATTTSTVIRQRIEGVRTLAGVTAVWSFYGKCDLAKTFNLFIFQSFGTGGTPSSTVITSPTAFNCGTSWSRQQFPINIPSLSGKTVGTDGNDYVEIVLQEAGSYSTFILDLAQIQLEKGSVATAFEQRPAGLELALAQRYFCKTYKQTQAPGLATALGTLNFGLDGVTTTSHSVRGTWYFPVVMRSIPIITFYDTVGTSGKWNDSAGAGASVGVVPGTTSDASVAFSVTTTSSNDARVLGHITADAEL